MDPFTRLREQGHEAAALAYRKRFTDRMCDLGEFVSKIPVGSKNSSDLNFLGNSLACRILPRLWI